MKIRVKKLSANAVIPSKAHASDAGFDMTCTRFEVADELSDSERGEGGYGSSGR